MNNGDIMNLLLQIIQAKTIIEQKGFEIEKSIFNRSNQNNGVKLVEKFEYESQIYFEDQVKEIYYNYLSIDLQWFANVNFKKYYGAFTMITLDQSLKYHNDLINLYYDSVDYAGDYPNPERVLDEIVNFYPIFIFNDGNAFCLDKRTSNIVFFDHSVFEFYDENFNGKLIANSYSELIERWSMILFLEQFWWSKDSLNNDGINLTSHSIAEFIRLIN